MTEDIDEAKMAAVEQIWHNGFKKAGLYHLFPKILSTAFRVSSIEEAKGIDFREDEEMLSRYINTIDLVIKQLLDHPEDIEKWKKQTPDEKKEELYDLFFDGALAVAMSIEESLKEQSEEDEKNSIVEAMSIIKETVYHYRRCNPIVDKEAARAIITRAFGRAANSKVVSGIHLEPGKELMSSEKIGKLGITKDKLIESFCMDPQVQSVDCVDGEFIINTIAGEIRFRLMFGDEASGGKA